MLLHGVKDTEFEIYHGDTLTNDWDMLRETNPAKKPQFDAVVANPDVLLQDRMKKGRERIAELAKRVEAGKADDTPEQLDTPGRRALYNNLGHNEELALEIDRIVKRVRQDDWRDNDGPKEKLIKHALLPLLDNDAAEVERVFLIIKSQKEY